MNVPELTAFEQCLEFKEHPNWRANPDKKRGVTWDAWCSRCGFKIEDAPFDNHRGLGISGSGRRLAFVTTKLVVGGVMFTADERRICCSECVPEAKG